MNNDEEIYGCLYECLWQSRCNDCPFNEIDQYSFKEKVIWFNSLTSDKKESIIDHHSFCFNKRNQKKN